MNLNLDSRIASSDGSNLWHRDNYSYMYTNHQIKYYHKHENNQREHEENAKVAL